MSIEEVKMLAAYMTAHSYEEDECCAIGHSAINKIRKSMIDGSFMIAQPALEGEAKDLFFKLTSGVPLSMDEEREFKRNIIRAAAIISGRMEDKTKGATEFKEGKEKNASYQTKKYSFLAEDSQADSVMSEKPSPKKRRKKTEK